VPPLTLAFVTTDYPPDPVASGIGSYTKSVAEGLAARGHRIHVVSRAAATPAEPQPRTVTTDSGVIVHRLRPHRLTLPGRMNPASVLRMLMRGLRGEYVYRRRLAAFIDDLIGREGVQLVEAPDTPAEMLAYAPSGHPRVPFVVRLHGPTSVIELLDRNVPETARRAMAWLERRQMLRATHLTCPSRAGADWIRQVLRLGTRPVTAYPNPPGIDAAPASAREPETEDPNLVLFVGRLTRSKGVETLIRAMPEVLRRCPDARLVLIGPDYPTREPFASTGAYVRHLMAPTVRTAVTFTGYLPPEQLAPYYRRAAVCVVPSLFEVFGYSCMEAMSHGKAIVASDRGGMAELLDWGACGVLCPPEDAGALAEAIIAVLADPQRRHQLGEMARARAATHFGREAVLDRAEAFYRDAIGELAATRHGAEGATPAGPA
jgi:glycogen synthase